MAVQSQQYPANVVHLPENHSNRARAPQYEVDHRGFLSGGINYNFQIPSSVNMNAFNQYHVCTQLCSGGRHMPTNQQEHDILAATAAFSTKFNAANAMMGARKRTRDQVEEFCSPWPNPPPPQQQQQQFVINATTQLDTHPGAVVNPATTANNVSTGLRLTFEDDTRLRSVSPPPPEPTWAEDFATYMQKERDEIAQLLKVQSGQLKSFLDERRQRRTRELITAAEEGFARKLREKDAEMEKIRRQNQELMDRFTQLNAESQHWQTKVRNTEAMVNVLRSNLAQAQQQNVAAAAAAQQFPPHPNTKEGCGDSEQADDCASSYVDDINDAHTRACNENRELREQRTCRVCRCNDVSMLLLPCRHLCLCQDCETQLHACPLCRTPKNASVQVYMS